MQILDDQKYIAQYDSQQTLQFVAGQPEQLRRDFAIATTASFQKSITNVVFAGMGGSALAAEFARTWPSLKVPFVVCKEYELPAFADEHTLVICASHSGNTEEALSILHEAEKKSVQIAIIASGGKLVERAKAAGHVLAQVPESLQPRMAVFFAYRALVEILVAADLLAEAALDELVACVDHLKQATALWAPSVPMEQNHAKQLADHLVGKTPIIYAGPKMAPAAYKWKIDVNENAKNTAWYNVLPEFSHNEFIGWSGRPVEKPFGVINLVSSFEHPRILKRFEVSDRMLSGMRPQAQTVEAVGQSPLEHLLYLVLLGDFTTLYLAFLNGVNPAPVDFVEKFKAELLK